MKIEVLLFNHRVALDDTEKGITKFLLRKGTAVQIRRGVRKSQDTISFKWWNKKSRRSQYYRTQTIILKRTYRVVLGTTNYQKMKIGELKPITIFGKNNSEIFIQEEEISPTYYGYPVVEILINPV